MITTTNHTAPIFKVGDLVLEAAHPEDKTPARIIDVIVKHDRIYYEIHFKFHAILQKVILPEYRFIKYTHS
jgi:hypothetical protein